MNDYHAAIGRTVGKVDTDSGGMARYSLELEVPPGINHNATPQISLVYCQGAPNGSLGAGWALGGLSCIRLALSTLPYDGPNVPNAGYDRSKPKLSLDGAELLNISGDYESPDAVYTTEMESVSCTVTRSGTGFVVREESGHWAEYGTTEDSCVLAAGSNRAREWRLKRRVDYHGNATTYDYVIAPTTGNINTRYLSSIRYSSNEKVGLQARRLIQFEYANRPDVVIQSVEGEKCTWASLLTAIKFGTLSDIGKPGTMNRSYEIGYVRSSHTGDSQLSSITETSNSDGAIVKLLPSLFGYTSTGVEPQKTFQGASSQVVQLETGSKRQQLALFTTNISGRCLADIACIQYNLATGHMVLKTYLASHNDDGTMAWSASDGPGAEADLPYIDKTDGFRNILCPDMTNDGRADIVIPYRDKDGFVCFSMSRCVGTGFEPASNQKTGDKWTKGSKFMAIDHSNRGAVDIIQIFALNNQQRLAFRNYAGVNNNGQISLKDPVTSETNYDVRETLEWFQMKHSGTGASSLARLWVQDVGGNGYQLKATTFTVAITGEIQELTTSLLGDPSSSRHSQASVLPCDINADGTQDLVVAFAKYENYQMVLNFSIFLGDGFGGFTKHGDMTRKADAPPPLQNSDYGKFHITNLDGTSYPSLSYVYQEGDAKSYVALSVDGRCDALLGDVRVNKLAGNLPSAKMQLVPVDINGKGTGDWLLYTLEQDNPRVLPVYNHAAVPDYLAWAQNPMGLRTSLKYLPMTDPTVYKSGVDWKRYENVEKDNYPVIAAPNYVVSQLQHENESSINSLSYNLTLKKEYANARIHTRGRGWQGFQAINTWNTTAKLLTTEKYLQAWPFTGRKLQIDTRTMDGATTLSSVRTSYESHERANGPWKISGLLPMLEETSVFERSTVARSNGTRYQHDEHGNLVLRSSFEQQGGKMMFQSYKRCHYTSIDGVTSVLVSEKISAKEGNVDMTKFEEGDCSLTLYENNSSRAILKGISEWSSDVGSFLKKRIVFNELGKEVETLSPAGLRRSTTYDDVFRSFAVKITEEGPGVSSTELIAYDEANGLEVATRETNGALNCFALDAFGRTFESRISAAVQGSDTVSAADFLKVRNFIAHPDLSAVIKTSHLNPQRTVIFLRPKSQSGVAYVGMQITTIAQEGANGRHQTTDYVDCVRQIRKRSSRNSEENQRTWMAWEFDSRGHQIFESFPVMKTDPDDLDWDLDGHRGVNVTVDILGRPITRVRPAHGNEDRFIRTSTTYLDGGARIQEKTFAVKSVDDIPTEADAMALIERRCIRIEDQDVVIESTDENGLRSTFEYNVFGKLIQCTDPAGKLERHEYNSLGDLIAIDNVYQNTAQLSGSTAITYKYNNKHQLEEQTNAAGESIRFTRDSSGRLLEKSGNDGRLVQLTYDTGNSGNIASITTFPHGVDQAFESSVHFTWDHRGRLSSRKLTLGNGENFTTSMAYDWQDRIIEKTLPDLAVARYEYVGARLTVSSISGGTTSTWSLEAETIKFSEYGRAGEIQISGTGMGFVNHQWVFDSLGFPTTHTLSLAHATLLQESYFYNDLDQMSRKHELVSAKTTDYGYHGRRLASSTRNGTEVSYEYDAAGNLVKNKDVNVTHAAHGSKGTKVNGQIAFDISYDGVGRMTARETPTSSFAFSYDSFGSLQSMTNSSPDSALAFLSDYEGRTLERKHSDGSGDLFISNDYSIHYNRDGSRTIHHRLFSSQEADGSAHLLGTVTTTHESFTAMRPLSKSRVMSTHFTDTKGNVTHTFDAACKVRETLDYDDFGTPRRSDTEVSDDVTTATYEGKYLEADAGLLIFGARWYDPLVGRFTTPDSILDLNNLALPDGLNRYAFENNDPINHVDPTGHWRWFSILAVVASAIMVVAAIVITIATAGVASPLLGAAIAAGVGALASAGVAGITFSVKHQDDDGGQFAKGYFTTIAVQAAIGAAAGAAGAFAGPASTIGGVLGRMAMKGAIGGAVSVLSTAGEREVENLFYGKHEMLFEGFAKTFAMGAIVGAGGGAFGNEMASPSKAFTLTWPKKILASTGANIWAGFGKEVAQKAGLSVLINGGGKLGAWGAKELGLPEKTFNFVKNEVLPRLGEGGHMSHVTR